MRRAFKILLGVGAVVVIVAIVAVVLLVSNLDRIVKEVIERVGTQVTGTGVTLDEATVSLRSAEGLLGGLTIANPAGFESPSALELDAIKIGIDTSSVGSDVIVLREVVVEGAHLTFEQRGEANNLQTILDHLESTDEAAESEPPDPESEVKMVIQTFRFTEGELTVLIEQLDEPLDLRIPEVVVEGIGRVETGETVASVARQLLEPVLEQAMDAARDQAKEILEQRAREELDKRKDEAIESLKDRLLGD